MRLIDKLKELRTKLISHKTDSFDVSLYDEIVTKRKSFNIDVFENNGLYKIEISDYISISDYLERIRVLNLEDIDSKLTSGVMWNGKKQCINKGIYFAFTHDDRQYCILKNENEIIIEERTKIGEEMQDKILEISLRDFKYHYFRCMHDKTGSSYDTRFYSRGSSVIKKLELTREEFDDDFNGLVGRLSTFEYILDVIDILEINNLIISSIDDTFIKKYHYES